jgi:hypothetical protein
VWTQATTTCYVTQYIGVPDRNQRKRMFKRGKNCFTLLSIMVARQTLVQAYFNVALTKLIFGVGIRFLQLWVTCEFCHYTGK